MSPDPSQYNHKLQIQQVTSLPITDVRGDEQVLFTNWKVVWGSIEPLAGREFQYAQQMHGNVTHKIRMRYIAGFQKDMRIIWNGRTFNVGPPLQVENWEIAFYATEVM